jgi:hypothetical protein
MEKRLDQFDRAEERPIVESKQLKAVRHEKELFKQDFRIVTDSPAS